MTGDPSADRSGTNGPPAAGCTDVFIVAGLCIVVSLLVYFYRLAIPDDAYIYARIAQNLASGQGWVYNAGVPTDAATSPLYVLMLAALETLGLTGRGCLLVAYAAGLLAMTALLYWQCRGRGRLLASLLAMGSLCIPALLPSVGLETSVFLALVVLTSAAYANGWTLWTGLCAGLTALARPEGIGLLMVLCCSDLIRSRRISWQMVSVTLAVVAPWLLFSYLDFGSVIPHTGKVKSLQADMLWWKRQGPWLVSFIEQVPGYFLVLPVAIFGVAVCARSLFWRRPFLCLIIAFGVLQTAGYSLLHAPVGYFWYYAPGNLAVYLAFVIGLAKILRACNAARSRAADHARKSTTSLGSTAAKAPLAYGLPAIMAVIIVALVADGSARGKIEGAYERLAAGHRPYRLSGDYMNAAAWLKQHADANEWVAADEIGYIGYYSGLKIRDMLGLLEINSIQPLARHQWDWWYTNYQSPQYIVVHAKRWIGEPGCTTHPWPPAADASFGNNYRLAYASGTVEVFQTKGAATSTPGASPMGTPAPD